MEMTLNVLVCSFDARISAVPSVLLPPRPDVRYVISHQQSPSYAGEGLDDETVISCLAREDVIYSPIEGVGLSRNRNNAIKSCARKAGPDDICLIADDDVKYPPGSFDKVLGAFREHDADIITFKISTGDPERPIKRYPPHAHEIRKPVLHGDGYVSSIEIAFRLSSVEGIRFDEDFGLKSPKYPQGGEETVFISDCLKKGLRIMYLPEEIVVHPYESTGKARKTMAKARMMLGMAVRCCGPLSVEAFIARARCIYRFFLTHERKRRK